MKYSNTADGKEYNHIKVNKRNNKSLVSSKYIYINSVSQDFQQL